MLFLCSYYVRVKTSVFTSEDRGFLFLNLGPIFFKHVLGCKRLIGTKRLALDGHLDPKILTNVAHVENTRFF